MALCLVCNGRGLVRLYITRRLSHLIMETSTLECPCPECERIAFGCFQSRATIPKGAVVEMAEADA